MATVTPAVHSPGSPKKSRVKKKVRMKEVVMEEDLAKPVDSFRVAISDVKAVLRVAEPRPVFLTFEFDNFWFGETNVYADGVQPVWGFIGATFKGADGKRIPPSKEVLPKNGVLPEARFVYETEFGYKLHRKFLVVKLAERSPYGDVEWGTGVLPLDSIARGCERTELSIVGKDGITVYGTVYCNIRMTNVQKIRAHLVDLKLSDYPEAYTYDVKLIYLELGLNGFENGHIKCTEKNSEAEPRFSAQPALEWETTLEDMLAKSTDTGKPSLKLFFAVHRQVARTRTEEIGRGAMPVRLLFSKVKEGWMDLPTKFMVPLANYKGCIRGKVLLRNIPQFSQLPGDDLVNVNGTVMPLDVDLTTRKLLPWIKLPKSWEARAPPPKDPADDAIREVESQYFTEAAPIADREQTQKNGHTQSHAVGNGQYHSPVTESASENGSESSDGPPSRKSNATGYSNVQDVAPRGRSRDPAETRQTTQRNISRKATSPLTVRDQIYATDPDVSGEIVYNVTAEEPAGRQMPDSHVPRSGQQQAPKNEWMRGMRKDEDPNVPEEPVAKATATNTATRSRHANEWMRGMRPEEEEADSEQDRMDVRANVALAASKVLGGGVRSNYSTAVRRESNFTDRSNSSAASRGNGHDGLEHVGRVSVRDAARQLERRWTGASTTETEIRAKDENDGSVHSFGGLRISEERNDAARHTRKASMDSGSVVYYYDGTTWEESAELGGIMKDRRDNKSGRSVGSAGTGDAGVEIGSLVMSVASDEGYGSRSTTEDVLTGSQRLGMGPPSDDRYDVEDVDCNCDDDGEVDVSGYAYVEDEEESEWMAIHDPENSRYYFAHRITQESLWLPPEWERLEDESGKQVFVDHGKRTIQQRFPAEEAKAYRESVYTAGG